jgi:hypothetical protein
MNADQVLAADGILRAAEVVQPAGFQRRAGVTGPDANGRTAGPRTWVALEHFGFR